MSFARVSAVVSVGLLSVGLAQAGEPREPAVELCPVSLTVAESVAAPPNYEGAATRMSHAFAGVSLFDGTPVELALLAPDTEKAKGARLTARWTFSSTRERTLYLICHYADTSATLARSAPPELTTCAISHLWDERTGIAEHPAVPPSFVCR